MTHAATFQTETTDGAARAGTLSLTHGTVQTPTFMPVGTRASVKGLDSAHLRVVGRGEIRTVVLLP